jgi:hypothetical protein
VEKDRVLSTKSRLVASSKGGEGHLETREPGDTSGSQANRSTVSFCRNDLTFTVSKQQTKPGRRLRTWSKLMELTRSTRFESQRTCCLRLCYGT